MDSTDDDEMEDEAAASLLASSTENLNKLGVTSASRLTLQAEPGTIEGTLERWHKLKQQSDGVGVSANSLKSLLKLAGYSVSAGLLLATPLLLYMALGMSQSSLPGLDSTLVNLSVLLFFSWWLVWNALGSLLNGGVVLYPVSALYKTLVDTVGEISQLKSAKGDIQIAAMVSPTKGIAASDIWAAHTAKRAWAVRGANISCRNGEVLVLLGNDGAGKTRLLTALVEPMVQPPKRSQSTTKVRGSLSAGGIDVAKWDRIQLKKRLGVSLIDVRTVTDLAKFMSGSLSKRY